MAKLLDDFDPSEKIPCVLIVSWLMLPTCRVWSHFLKNISWSWTEKSWVLKNFWKSRWLHSKTHLIPKEPSSYLCSFWHTHLCNRLAKIAMDNNFPKRIWQILWLLDPMYCSIFLKLKTFPGWMHMLQYGLVFLPISKPGTM